LKLRKNLQPFLSLKERKKESNRENKKRREEKANRKMMFICSFLLLSSESTKLMVEVLAPAKTISIDRI
jgi:hypothetical protein